MRVYVAGRFTNRERIGEYMRELRTKGFIVTHDWTKEDSSNLHGAERDQYLASCAQADVDGVQSADALVLVYDPTSRGAFVELGVAISEEIPICVVMEDVHDYSCIFVRLPGIRRVATWHQAVRLLEEQRSLTGG